MFVVFAFVWICLIDFERFDWLLVEFVVISCEV